MILKKYKWLFYIFTFFLITIVATILKEIQGKNIPQITSAILLVGIAYGFIYLSYKLFKTIFRSHKKISVGLKINKTIIIFTVIGFLTLGAFYWFYWRPGEVRKSCSYEAYRRAKEKQNTTLGNNIYRYCLTQHGLRPESLFVDSN